MAQLYSKINVIISKSWKQEQTVINTENGEEITCQILHRPTKEVVASRDIESKPT